MNRPRTPSEEYIDAEIAKTLDQFDKAFGIARPRKPFILGKIKSQLLILASEIHDKGRLSENSREASAYLWFHEQVRNMLGNDEQPPGWTSLYTPSEIEAQIAATEAIEKDAPDRLTRMKALEKKWRTSAAETRQLGEGFSAGTRISLNRLAGAEEEKADELRAIIEQDGV